MNSTYSIKDLELLSGIKAHTIRIWEQRYGLFNPERTDTNIRQYTDEDLKLLLNISILNSNGFKISKISKLDADQVSKETFKILNEHKSSDERIDGLKHAMLTFNESLFVKIINDDSFTAGFEKTVEKLIYPFLKLVGELWHTGAITPLHEHFVSALIRQKLLVAIDLLPVPKGVSSEGFILVCPEGEMHEIGLLYANYIIRSRGVFTLYLGTNVPAIDVLKVWETSGIENILINIVVNNNKLNDFVKTLYDKMSENNKMYLSGSQIDKLMIDNDLSNAYHLKSVKELIDELEKRRLY